MKVFLFYSLFFTLLGHSLSAQERPFIWVKNSEREVILSKIEDESWAHSLFEKFKQRLDQDIGDHQSDPADFLSRIPFNWAEQIPGKTPPLKNQYRDHPQEKSDAKIIMHYLQAAIDCGVMYYLVEDERYAQCALDIINAFIQGIIQLPFPEEKGNHGWVYPEDHLYEVRILNAQIPIIYDFIFPYVEKGGMPFDVGLKRKTLFPSTEAQEVFRKFVHLAIEQGMTGSNWSVLEAPGLVQNCLALDDEEERNSFLHIYLFEGSDRQDPLVKIASHFEKPGDVYPETSQYSNGVASYTTTLLTILTKYDPGRQLASKYINIPLALSRWELMKYPNNQLLRFGDGKRKGGANFFSYETAYYLGTIDSLDRLRESFGDLITTALTNGEYNRDELNERTFGASPYFDPLRLLWFVREIEGSILERKIPRTDHLPHASVFLQRNLSSSQKPEDGLMCFVGGAPMVHGHASGMDMELYGRGQVLGVDNGNGAYRQDIHENYSRLFAAHNTVIVNGSSRSDSGWVNLGINPVELITMEPLPTEEAISPYYSFTQTRFEDNKGDQAEASQQRTLSLIRTSPTTGYYVDVFRSKSKLPGEFHDYLYHNIGDELNFEEDDLTLVATNNRYMANATLPWIQNRQYRHPGWHFFKEVKSSAEFAGEVKAHFSINQLNGKPIYMGLHIPGFANREYSKVLAPHTFEAPPPYDDLPTPTLVIRQKGDAWDRPFVIVYEAFEGNLQNQSIQTVKKLEQEGKYKGLRIESRIDTILLIQYVITQPENENFLDRELNIEFQGTFAIITTNAAGKLQNMYIGEGEMLRFRRVVVKPAGDQTFAYRDFSKKDH
jgi:hypothetical protein